MSLYGGTRNRKIKRDTAKLQVKGMSPTTLFKVARANYASFSSSFYGWTG